MLCFFFSIGNLVWSDVNNNGIRDNSESAYSNIKLYLYNKYHTAHCHIPYKKSVLFFHYKKNNWANILVTKYHTCFFHLILLVEEEVFLSISNHFTIII